MDSHDVFKQSVEGHVGAIAERLGLHPNSVYKMMAEPEFCRYTRWLPLFIAIYEENPIGGEAIFEDFRAVVLRLREAKNGSRDEEKGWRDAVAETVRESAEAITAEIENKDPAEVEKEIVEAITSFRAMLMLVRARASGEVLDLPLRRSSHG